LSLSSVAELISEARNKAEKTAELLKLFLIPRQFVLENQRKSTEADMNSSRWDHSSHEVFYQYYAHASQSATTVQRFLSTRDAVVRFMTRLKIYREALEVADVGCGAGTQAMIWAGMGHRVHGLDVSNPLIQLATQRSAEAGLKMEFVVGSAASLPWEHASMDVCLVPELLEHVENWKQCISEFARILKPRGILFLSTTNKLCPKQLEYDLPLYSWYPAVTKRYFERLAMGKRPEIVNFAKYPAVNWFSYYSLRSALQPFGFRCFDRFDVMDLSDKGMLANIAVAAIRALPIMRWLAHVATPATLVFAVREQIPAR
jgi:2-polyprenyl-3-methyl-5-hydroxy-6-metoxy-1,4-benzoquinol methylase